MKNQEMGFVGEGLKRLWVCIYRIFTCRKENGLDREEIWEMGFRKKKKKKKKMVEFEMNTFLV